jgi:hypothetical protein
MLTVFSCMCQAMELRKLCNHPFLSNSVADNMVDCRRFEARGQLDVRPRIVAPPDWIFNPVELSH